MTELAKADTVYSLQLFSAYAAELDSLPIELSKNFADLRELDAVLSSSIGSLIARIQHLTKLIEDQASPATASSSTAEDRLYLLTEIANETQRLKLGNEDKIRVSSQAADSLGSHSAYMSALLERVPNYDLALLQRGTAFPHVAPFVPAMVTEGGRRRRNNANSMLDPDRSPRKVDRVPDTNRVRNNGRRRGASPAESILSVNSHMPPTVSQSNSRTGVQNGPSVKTVNGTATNKRVRGNQNTPPVHDQNFDYSNNTGYNYDDGEWVAPNAGNSGSGGGGGGGGGGNGGTSGGGGGNSADVSLSSISMNQGGDGGDDGNDDDGRTYCFCNGPSYGEMIGCDGEDCEAEWFHLACVGLTACPQGSWYCEKCTSKRAKRAGRGGKRRAAGGRNVRNRDD